MIRSHLLTIFWRGYLHPKKYCDQWKSYKVTRKEKKSLTGTENRLIFWKFQEIAHLDVGNEAKTVSVSINYFVY